MANRTSSAALAALLLLGACQSSPEDQPNDAGGNSVPIEEREEEIPDAPVNETSDPDLTEPEGSMAGSLPGGVIPAQFRGRWGLVPADCGPDKGSAKGLLTIGSEILRFYESVAEPVTLDRTDDRAISGSFAFSGEGMEWTRAMTLTLGTDGETLVRTEAETEAGPQGSYTYTRCPG